jgi:hypothetical protein
MAMNRQAVAAQIQREFVRHKWFWQVEVRALSAWEKALTFYVRPPLTMQLNQGPLIIVDPNPSLDQVIPLEAMSTDLILALALGSLLQPRELDTNLHRALEKALNALLLQYPVEVELSPRFLEISLGESDWQLLEQGKKDFSDVLVPIRIKALKSFVGRGRNIKSLSELFPADAVERIKEAAAGP